jgi:hypothetical protein
MKAGKPALASGPASTAEPDLRLAARGLAYLYAASSALVGLSLALPHPPVPSEALLALPAVFGYAVAGLLLAFPERVPRRLQHLLLVLASCLVTLMVYLSKGAIAYAAYVWVALYAFYFFSRLPALAHIVGVAAAYGAALAAGG